MRQFMIPENLLIVAIARLTTHGCNDVANDLGSLSALPSSVKVEQPVPELKSKVAKLTKELAKKQPKPCPSCSGASAYPRKSNPKMPEYCGTCDNTRIAPDSEQPVCDWSQGVPVCKESHGIHYPPSIEQAKHFAVCPYCKKKIKINTNQEGIMEPEWLTYLRDNRPDLYAKAVAQIKWASEWRDKELKDLKDEKSKLNYIQQICEEYLDPEGVSMWEEVASQLMEVLPAFLDNKDK